LKKKMVIGFTAHDAAGAVVKFVPMASETVIV